jgi:hypothetical protein
MESLHSGIEESEEVQMEIASNIIAGDINDEGMVFFNHNDMEQPVIFNGHKIRGNDVVLAVDEEIKSGKRLLKTGQCTDCKREDCDSCTN